MERLQKILASAGLGSRRHCETLILQGRVIVDGEVVTTLGTKVDVDKQRVTCDGELVKAEKKKYYLFYKPKNCLCTNAQTDIPRVIDYFSHVSYRLFTVGRLDKDSEGLILVTNDGKFSQKLAHPKSKIEKVYRVVVRGFLTRKNIEQISNGLWISEGKVTPEKVRLVKSNDTSSIVEVTLTEGKNRAIRRIFARVGCPVSSLTRIRFAMLDATNLKPGKHRVVTEQEVKKLLSLIKDEEVSFAFKSKRKRSERKIQRKNFLEKIQEGSE